MTRKKNFFATLHTAPTGKRSQKITEIREIGGQSGEGTIPNGNGLHVRSQNRQKRPDDADLSKLRELYQETLMQAYVFYSIGRNSNMKYDITKMVK